MSGSTATQSSGVITRWRSSVRTVLFDPDRFYAERETPLAAWKAFLLVALAGVVGSIGVYYGVETIAGEFTIGGLQADGPILTDQAGIILYSSILRPILDALILWVLYATAFYALSWLYTERGSYFRLVRDVAWGFLPYLLYNAIVSVAMIVAFWSTEIDTSVPVGNDQQVVNWLLDQGRTEPVVLVASLVGIALLAWSGYVWSYAVQYDRYLDRRNALVVTAIPVAVHALFILRNVLEAASVL